MTPLWEELAGQTADAAATIKEGENAQVSSSDAAVVLHEHSKWTRIFDNIFISSFGFPCLEFSNSLILADIAGDIADLPLVWNFCGALGGFPGSAVLFSELLVADDSSSELELSLSSVAKVVFNTFKILANSVVTSCLPRVA